MTRAVRTFRSLSQIHFAAKDCVVFHGESKCTHIALTTHACAQLHTACRHNVALDVAQNQNVLG